MDGHCGVICLDSFHPLLDKSCRKTEAFPQSHHQNHISKTDIYLSVLFLRLLLHKLIAHSVRENRKVFEAALPGPIAFR